MSHTRRTATLAVILGLLAAVLTFIAPTAPVQAAQGMAALANSSKPITVIHCASAVWGKAIKTEARVWQASSQNQLEIVFENAHGDCTASRDTYCDWYHTCIIEHSAKLTGKNKTKRYIVTYHSPRMVWLTLNSSGRTSWTNPEDEFQRYSAAGASIGRALGMPVRVTGSTVMNAKSKSLWPGALDKALLLVYYKQGGSW